MEYKSNTAYFAHHVPSKEEWFILGIDTKGNRVCAGGWPPSIGNLSDCIDFEERRPLTKEEIEYRNKTFGHSWL